MLVMNCFKMWANNELINILNVDRPALSDVRWQMDGDPLSRGGFSCQDQP